LSPKSFPMIIPWYLAAGFLWPGQSISFLIDQGSNGLSSRCGSEVRSFMSWNFRARKNLGFVFICVTWSALIVFCIDLVAQNNFVEFNFVR
jgi:hypothetical protein